MSKRIVRLQGRALCVLACLGFLLGTPAAWSFSFADYEAQERAEEQAQRQAAQHRLQRELETPCPAWVKDSRIMVSVTETDNGRQRLVRGEKYNRLFERINAGLRSEGFRTLTPQEIQDQIGREQQRAYLENDLDAALNAANALGADYVLTANIATVSRPNPIINVNDVFVTMSFALQDKTGRGISYTEAKADSFAGGDVLGVAEDLVRARSSAVVGRIYADLCRHGAGR
jgi:hypothetical protein